MTLKEINPKQLDLSPLTDVYEVVLVPRKQGRKYPPTIRKQFDNEPAARKYATDAATRDDLTCVALHKVDREVVGYWA